MDYDPLRRGFAEFVGTFTLVFIGAGSILTLGAALNFARFPGPVGPLFTLVGVAFAHGLAIAVMASAVGHISGGHFNPAITLGFLITRRLAPMLGLVYWLAQISAAALAALLLRWLYDASTRDSVKLGAPALGAGTTHWQGFVIEIGLTIPLDILMGGPLTGAAMNPARAFGPQLVQNTWKDAWVWYAGPFAGGALAAVLYEWLYLRPVRPLPVGPPETGVIEPRPGEAAVS